MGSPLEVSENPIPEDQPLEQPDGALNPPIPHGYFQWTVAWNIPTRRGIVIPLLSIPEGHASSLPRLGSVLEGLATKKEKRR
jgi:hypothetical protein